MEIYFRGKYGLGYYVETPLIKLKQDTCKRARLNVGLYVNGRLSVTTRLKSQYQCPPVLPFL